MRFLGDSEKANHFPPNLEHDANIPFTIESDSSYEPLNSFGQQHANLQKSHQPLNKTTANNVKGTSAGSVTGFAGFKKPVSVAKRYCSSS